MKALIWLIRGLLAAVLVTMLVAGGMLLYSSSVKEEDPPVLLGYAPFTVANSEMTPSLYPGDLAILRMGTESQPGDIVAFRKEGELVLRRIVGTSEGMYITQQEAFGQPDVDLLDPARVEAVCATYLPGCGALAAFLYSPTGLAVLVVLALALLVVPVLLTRDANVRQEGPAVDYGEEEPRAESPAPRRAAPTRARKWYADLDDYEDGEDDGENVPAPAPRRQTYAPPREAPRPARRTAEKSAPATPRRGGSHYKPRH